LPACIYIAHWPSAISTPLEKWYVHFAPVSPTAVLAVDVCFSEDALIVRLFDGREVSVPLEWFPRLRGATSEQRKDWRLIAGGIGIHWEAVDEDIAVATLLRSG
jgi:hypothetical protein